MTSGYVHLGRLTVSCKLAKNVQPVFIPLDELI